MEEARKYDTDDYCGKEDPLNLGGTENLYGLANEAETLGLNNLSIDDLDTKKMNFIDLDDDLVMVSSDETFLEILEQPVTKFRFRYKAEMQGTHGQLKGINSKNQHKTFPTVKLHGYSGTAVIHCSVFQPDPDIKTHHLLIRANNKGDILDPIEMIIRLEDDYTAKFSGMGIMFIKKDDIEKKLIQNTIEKAQSELKRKLKKTEQTQIENDCRLKLKTRPLNMNEIKLRFEAFSRNEKTGKLDSLCPPVLSNPIQHSMGTKTGNLKIVYSSRSCGKATGDDEIILLTEKVDKENIKVRFFELGNNKKRIWLRESEFPASRVHRQFAIILHTPPYRDVNITEQTEVYIELFRPGSETVVEESSDPIKFTYLPCEVCPRKRKKLSIESNSDFKVPMSVEEENTEKSIELSLQDLIENFDDPNLDNENFVEKIDSNDLINVERNLSISINNNILMENDSLNTLNFTSLKQIPTIFELNILHRYIRLGRIADAKNALKIVLILKQLQLLQLTNEHDETCLHVACVCQEHDIAKSLLKAGVNPNFKNKDGNAALHISIEQLDICMVTIFCDCIRSPTKLSKSFDKDLVNYTGMSYLHLAIKKSSYPIVKKLIDLKVSTNVCTTNNGSNVLHLAVEQEDDSILKLLMTKVNKELINQKNSMGETPISLAKSLKKINFLGILNEQDIPYEINKNNCDKSNYLDDKTIKQLSNILNKNDKWKELAALLSLSEYVCAWTSADKLLNHINRPDSRIPTDEIVSKLKELKEPKIDEIIKKYVNDVIGIK